MPVQAEPPPTKILAADLHSIKLDDIPSSNESSSMKRLSGLFLMKGKKLGDSSTDLLSRWRGEEKNRRDSDYGEREKQLKQEEEESLQELRKMREEEKRKREAADRRAHV